jgi:hydrogenase maturation factor
VSFWALNPFTLYISNERKVLAFLRPDYARKIRAMAREGKFGKDKCIIAEVAFDRPDKVFMETVSAGLRIVDMFTIPPPQPSLRAPALFRPGKNPAFGLPQHSGL